MLTFYLLFFSLSDPLPPYKLTFTDVAGKRKAEDSTPPPEEKTIIVEPHIIPNRGPYPYNQPKKNAVPFTPTQVEAIRAGMQPGTSPHAGPACSQVRQSSSVNVMLRLIHDTYHYDEIV